MHFCVKKLSCHIDISYSFTFYNRCLYSSKDHILNSQLWSTRPRVPNSPKRCLNIGEFDCISIITLERTIHSVSGKSYPAVGYMNLVVFYFTPEYSNCHSLIVCKNNSSCLCNKHIYWDIPQAQSIPKIIWDRPENTIK